MRADARRLVWLFRMTVGRHGGGWTAIRFFLVLRRISKSLVGGIRLLVAGKAGNRPAVIRIHIGWYSCADTRRIRLHCQIERFAELEVHWLSS